MEKAMAPHSSTLSRKIPWTEEPGRLQSMGSLRVGHDWATSLSFFSFMHWRRKWHPLQCSCLENPRDGGAWWAAVYGVAQSRTRLSDLAAAACLFNILQLQILDTCSGLGGVFWGCMYIRKQTKHSDASAMNPKVWQLGKNQPGVSAPRFWERIWLKRLYVNNKLLLLVDYQAQREHRPLSTGETQPSR